MKNTNLIPIGQFSKMTRLSVKALRLYDEKGFLPPCHVDPSSGYRYYNSAQVNRAEIIKILRSVDMPLDEIQAILDTDDNELANTKLQRHRERLATNLTAQQQMLTYLESIIMHKEKIMPYEITVTEEKARLVAAVKIHTSLSCIGNDISEGFVTLMKGLERVGVLVTDPPLIIYHQLIDEESDGDIEICAPINKTFSADKEIYHRELESGTMATTVHRGPYEKISPAYHSATNWISNNSYEITGPPRETYLNDPQVIEAEELLTRLQFPVHSKITE